VSLDRDERTELHNAIFDKDIEKSICLIESGKYDIDQADNNGFSPLHAAATSQLVPVLIKLIEFGADVNSVDAWGNPPIQRALGNKPENEQMISELLSAGADIKVLNKSGNSVATHVGKIKGHPNHEQLKEYL